MSPVLSILDICLLILTILFFSTASPLKDNLTKSSSQNRSPVILVPGDGGSQLFGMLNKTRSRHIFCTKHTDKWEPMWLNLVRLTPWYLDCLVEDLKLVFNNETKTTSNSPGVKIKTATFGDVAGVNYLDESKIVQSAYFINITNALVKQGYKVNVDIKGAPYDFRQAPNEMGTFIPDFKKLIEDTYTENANRPVTLIAHSMGNPTILYFMNHQTQAWKDKYIHTYVSLAGPWGGAAKALRLYASGDNLGLFTVNKIVAREVQRTLPSSAWLMPYEGFWAADEPIVFTPFRNYTVTQYEQFFKDIDYPIGWEMRKATVNLIKDLHPPGIPVHCLYGADVRTPLQFYYESGNSWFKWNDEAPSAKKGYGLGDGTVNKRSLEGCIRWKGKQSQPVFNKGFSGIDHMTVLSDKKIIDYILKVL